MNRISLGIVFCLAGLVFSPLRAVENKTKKLKNSDSHLVKFSSEVEAPSGQIEPDTIYSPISHPNKLEIFPPINGNIKIIQKFNENSNSPYKGVLIESKNNSKTLSCLEGKVIAVEFMEGYEIMVVLDHGNAVYSIYANLSEVWVREGDFVPRGKELGVVNPKKHLYFQFNKGIKSVDPVQALFPEK